MRRRPVSILVMSLVVCFVVLLQVGCGSNGDDSTATVVEGVAATADDTTPDEAVTPDETPTAEQLIEAVRAGQLEEVRRLLDAGADVNGTGNATSGSWVYVKAPAITHAVLVDQKEIVELLIAYGADMELGEQGYRDTALHTAAHLDHADIVTVLLESGANPAPISRHTNWETPMHYAAEAGATSAIQALLDGGVDVDVRVDDGRSALMNIIRQVKAGVSIKVATFLLERGADPNLQDGTGRTALHYAAQTIPKLVPVVLEHGADADAQTTTGDTALHLAARAGKVDAVEALLDHGASAELENQQGETALEVATRDEIVGMLQGALT